MLSVGRDFQRSSGPAPAVYENGANYSHKRHKGFLESSQQRQKLLEEQKSGVSVIATHAWGFENPVFPLPDMLSDHHTGFVSPSLTVAIYSTASSSNKRLKSLSNVYIKRATHPVLPSPQNITQLSPGHVPSASLALMNKENRQAIINSAFTFSLKVHLWHILPHRDKDTYSQVWQSAVCNLENLMVTVSSPIICILWQWQSWLEYKTADMCIYIGHNCWARYVNPNNWSYFPGFMSPEGNSKKIC